MGEDYLGVYSMGVDYLGGRLFGGRLYGVDYLGGRFYGGLKTKKLRVVQSVENFLMG